MGEDILDTFWIWKLRVRSWFKITPATMAPWQVSEGVKESGELCDHFMVLLHLQNLTNITHWAFKFNTAKKVDLFTFWHKPSENKTKSQNHSLGGEIRIVTLINSQKNYARVVSSSAARCFIISWIYLWKLRKHFISSSRDSLHTKHFPRKPKRLKIPLLICLSLHRHLVAHLSPGLPGPDLAGCSSRCFPVCRHSRRPCAPPVAHR